MNIDALVGIRGNEDIPDLEEYRTTFRAMSEPGASR